MHTQQWVHKSIMMTIKKAIALKQKFFFCTFYVCTYYVLTTGNGAINSLQVFLSASSFLSDPPTFTLFGDTSGGPPTTYTWTRNGSPIEANDIYSFSIQVNGRGKTVFQNSNYTSTLTVTGILPGVYQYSVTNRATPTTVNDSFTIEGNINNDVY